MVLILLTFRGKHNIPHELRLASNFRHHNRLRPMDSEFLAAHVGQRYYLQ